jgi:FtsP/CotA-like multicopper oxidase with cupredoxin domain
VDGQTWDDLVKDDLRKVVATPNLDEAQVWELESPSRGWFDPLRIHLIGFKILDRNGKPPFPGSANPRTSPTSARTRRRG